MSVSCILFNRPSCFTAQFNADFAFPGQIMTAYASAGGEYASPRLRIFNMH